LLQLVSPHGGGAHALFADGMTRFLESSINATTLLSLLTKKGGEVLSGG
jgi:prepilin-type processing-associated H-X9-DG protein